jgi:hypothetical protein
MMVDTCVPKRRWFQFSLRTLMLFVLLCSIVCSWVAVTVNRQRQLLFGNAHGGWGRAAAPNPLIISVPDTTS